MGQKAILMAGLLTVALSACGGPFSMEETAGGEGALSGSQALQSGDGSACSMERSCAVLYIGVGNQFAEYPVEYTGELDENGQIPPEEVVSAMASLTGWSLDLAEPIFSGRAGSRSPSRIPPPCLSALRRNRGRSSVFMTPSSWTRRFWTA